MNKKMNNGKSGMCGANGLNGADHSTTPVLDALRFPLYGSRLIEASAGTGKTFTIAALYLRFILGHDIRAICDTPQDDDETRPTSLRALTPPEILVVTFTEAATKELRERIRARLAQAARFFQRSLILEHQHPPDHAHDADAFLIALRDDYPASAWAACARKLQLASEWMDEAAVSTIHGWCHRMLSEHAFDSDSLFTQTLEADQRELLEEVIRDYWRTFFYPLDVAGVQDIQSWWSSPDELRSALVGLLRHLARLPQGRAPHEALQQTRDAVERALHDLKAPFLDERAGLDAFRVMLDRAVEQKQVNGKKFQRRWYLPWLDALSEWAQTPMMRAPTLAETAWERLSPAGLIDGWKPDAGAPSHPVSDALALLRAQIAALPDAREDIVCHAAHWVATRFAAEQAARAQMGFDELLTRLDHALSGPNGERLATLIRQQYPVALIDEFQDTDPVQYRIFDTIYRVADNDADHALILIGDPKQAIYAFRGADIHTYLSARRDTAGRHATLATNFRSSKPMVEAVNHAFNLAERRGVAEFGADMPQAGQSTLARGAFLFRRGEKNDLPFSQVSASGRAETWQIDGVPAVAMTAWCVVDEDAGLAESTESVDAPRMMAVSQYVSLYAQQCASEVVRLLALGRQGRAGFVGASPDGALTPVQPHDIAILVNDGWEATAVRAALLARGVRSVYLSDKESVYASPMALQLQRWLMACAAPDDDRALRSALASSCFGLNWVDLDRLNHDEIAWEAQVVQFRGYQMVWRRQGVLPMVRRLLNDFAVPQRLLEAGDERALTDILHLAELLQQASSVLEGEHVLIRYLTEQRAKPDAQGDARQVRLESDAALIKVVTVHKSKGLEYPLVFLPFACRARVVTDKHLPLTWHDEAGQSRVSLSASPNAVQAADDARLGEDVRKLYVALTRARFATWIGVAATAGLERSALGHLLTGGAPSLSSTQLLATLNRFAESCDGWGVVPVANAAQVNEVDASLLGQRAADAVVLSPERVVSHSEREPWWIASYSALRLDEGSAELGDAYERDHSMTRLTDDDVPQEEASAIDAIYADSDAGDAGGLSEDDAFDAEVAEDDEGQSYQGDDDERRDRQASSSTSRHEDGYTGGHAETDDGDCACAIEIAVGLLHEFPRGAHPGTFLHGLLEWTGRAGFADVAMMLSRPVPTDADVADAAALSDVDVMLRRRCDERGWSSWRPALRCWLEGWLQCAWTLPDSHAPVRFAALATSAYRVELDFLFAVNNATTMALDRCVQAAVLPGEPRFALLPAELNGMLKGFIDLVFEHEGRYYVVDFKSNYLGPGDDDYSTRTMQAAILDKRYELQYVLYIFALHRLLASRLPDYDYDRHIGGSITMFLRGSAAPGQGLYIDRPTKALIEQLEALFSAPA